jgi:uncharacterized protein YbaR (Trm112 family)
MFDHILWCPVCDQKNLYLFREHVFEDGRDDTFKCIEFNWFSKCSLSGCISIVWRGSLSSFCVNNGCISTVSSGAHSLSHVLHLHWSESPNGSPELLNCFTCPVQSFHISADEGKETSRGSYFRLLRGSRCCQLHSSWCPIFSLYLLTLKLFFSLSVISLHCHYSCKSLLRHCWKRTIN